MAKGSQTAFDQLYLRYFDRLVTHIVQVTKDVEAAEDIAQDAFLKMWQQRASFTKYQKISGWLFVTTYNGALNHLRKIAREHLRIETMQQQLRADNAAILEEQFLLLEAAIAQLPPQRRKVFQLCRLEGMTYEQAAQHLSISRNTVKEHLSKATAFLAQYVKDSPDGTFVMLAFLWATSS